MNLPQTTQSSLRQNRKSCCQWLVTMKLLPDRTAVFGVRKLACAFAAKLASSD
jgi:hypothetical protein